MESDKSRKGVCSMKKVIRILSLAVLLVLAFSLVACSSYKSPLKVMEKIAEGKASKSDVKSMMPEKMWEKIADLTDVGVDDLIEEVAASMEEGAAEDVKVTIKVKDSGKIDGDELDEFNESLKAYGLEATAGKTVEVEAVSEVDGEKEEEEVEYHMVKIDGEWYCAELLSSLISSVAS